MLLLYIMDTSLILLIIGFIVIAFLILKLIKKVIVAVFTIVFVFILLCGAVVGLVYLDMNNLMEGKNYDVNIVYAKGDNYELGVNLPIEDRNIDVQNIEGISEEQLSNLDPKEITKNDNTFVVVVDEVLYGEILSDKGYNLADAQDLGLGEIADDMNIDVILTKEDVLEIMDSDDDVGTFVDILFEENDLDNITPKVLKSVAEDELSDALDDAGVSLKEFLFVYTLQESLDDSQNIVTLLDGFKDKDLEVYPDRLTFKALRTLPVDTLKGYIDDVNFTSSDSSDNITEENITE